VTSRSRRTSSARSRRLFKAFGGLDVLVWNSGGPKPGPGTAVTPESLECRMFFPSAIQMSPSLFGLTAIAEVQQLTFQVRAGKAALSVKVLPPSVEV